MAAGPITFDYEQWVVLFPEFAGVSEAAAQNYWNMAQLYVRNDGRGPINDVNMLTTLLNLMTAHIAKLFSMQTNGVATTGGVEGPAGTVGRVASATEGTVTVQLDFPNQQPNAAWLNQTSYGAMVWALMRPYRTFRYLGPRHRRTYAPPARYWGNIGGL